MLGQIIANNINNFPWIGIHSKTLKGFIVITEKDKDTMLEGIEIVEEELWEEDNEHTGTIQEQIEKAVKRQKKRKTLLNIQSEIIS
jgi:hypothetical protein